MTNPTIDLTETSIRSVARKLQRFSDELPPDEQAVLAWLLQRAQEAEEVAGYAAAPIPSDHVQEAVLDALGFSVPR
jgi:hypothetical protein